MADPDPDAAGAAHTAPKALSAGLRADQAEARERALIEKIGALQAEVDRMKPIDEVVTRLGIPAAQISGRILERFEALANNPNPTPTKEDDMSDNHAHADNHDKPAPAAGGNPKPEKKSGGGFAKIGGLGVALMLLVGGAVFAGMNLANNGSFSWPGDPAGPGTSDITPPGDAGITPPTGVVHREMVDGVLMCGFGGTATPCVDLAGDVPVVTEEVVQVASNGGVHCPALGSAKFLQMNPKPQGDGWEMTDRIPGKPCGGWRRANNGHNPDGNNAGIVCPELGSPEFLAANPKPQDGRNWEMVAQVPGMACGGWVTYD